MFEEVLVVQVKVTLCDTVTAVAVKFTPVIEAPFTVMDAEDGLKVCPD